MTRYDGAKEIYARMGVDTEKALDALKDVTPMQWKDGIYTGKEKVIVNKQGISYVQNR